jgi:hypothetical protein
MMLTLITGDRDHAPNLGMMLTLIIGDRDHAPTMSG